MKYKTVRGMEDVLPKDIAVWQGIEQIARFELECCGYKEIRTPILEDTAVFTRSIGETTDIVTKEMYTFADRKERSLTMRPEGTAPIVRAYVEHSLDKASRLEELYYIGPMFRSERPQKGRSRQFHQIGIEVIGSRSPQIDAEVIIRLNRMLKAFGLEDFLIKINSLGCDIDKNNFTNKLRNYLEKEKAKLCDDCKKRTEKNPMRVLDCKNEYCRLVVKAAPAIAGSLCEKCITHFATVKAMLEIPEVDIKFREDPNLVRGLDYYTGPVFEVTHPKLGGQDALAAGGRYDNLVKEFGGPDVGAAGFAIGMERLILALGDKQMNISQPTVLYIATLGNNARTEGIKLREKLINLLNKIHNLNCTIYLNLEEASPKSQMRSADKRGAKITLILGDDEIKAKKVTIKDMIKGEQQPVTVDILENELLKIIKR